MKSAIVEPGRFVILIMLLEATVLFKTDRNQTILDRFATILEPDRFVIMPLEATVLFQTDRDHTMLDHFVKHFGARPFRDNNNASGGNRFVSIRSKSHHVRPCCETFWSRAVS